MISIFNIDLLKAHSNSFIKNYADNLISYSVKCTINKPTRCTINSKTLLDHIYINNLKYYNFSGIVQYDISDHLPTFIFVHNTEIKNKVLKDILIRDMKKFSLELFCNDLSLKMNNLKVSEDSSPHHQFQTFIEIFTDTVNFHASYRRTTRKEKKLKEKPWLTKGLLKSIKHKNKMYKKFLDCSNCSLYTQYKKYRNTLNRALECAKRNYYSKILIQNKHNIGKVYEKINEICELKSKKRVLPNKIADETGSHIEDPQYIAETFNNYFAYIGHKMAESISEPPQKLPISQLHTYSANSFFMFPSSTDEIAQLIESLNDKKTVRSNDVETRFIKYSKSIILPIISDLFNLCVNKGVFPNCLKIAEIIPIYKKGN